MPQRKGRRVVLRGVGTGTVYSKNIRNVAFRVYARDFLNASVKTRSPIVKSYLLGHSLELYLKTYLLTCGDGEGSLQKMGHNLESALTRCRKLDEGDFPTVSQELKRDLAVFNGAYMSHAFRYFSILHLLTPPRLPPLTRLNRFVKNVQKVVDMRVRAA